MRESRQRVFGDDRWFAGDVEGAAAAVLERALSGAGGYACLCNAHVLATAHRDPALRAALASASFRFADGWPVSWLQRRHGARAATRVTGTDLMARTFELGEPLGLRHFLFGASDEVLRRLERRLRERHPAARIVGAYAPPFAPADGVAMDTAAEVVAAAEAEVVWCAIGAPKQELWMSRHAARLSPALLLGVGAAFEFLAGTKKRAPVWMQNASLEWLHRLALEPRRLGSRYLRTNTQFAAIAAAELVRGRRPA